MMKSFTLIGLASAALLFSCGAPAPSDTAEAAPTTPTTENTESNQPSSPTPAMKSFHDFTVNDLEGQSFDLAQFKGKKVLVVNTASECGLTPQYTGLQELYDQFGGDNFAIVGFPANNFGAQEPGTDEEIRGFCTKNYGVTFPMMSKISVKGDDQHALYQWLTSKAQNGVEDNEVQWNFHKYLIDENGQLVRNVAPTTEPADPAILDWIQS